MAQHSLGQRWALVSGPAGGTRWVSGAGRPGVAPGGFPDCVLWPQEGRGGTRVVSAWCRASLASEPQCLIFAKGLTPTFVG